MKYDPLILGTLVTRSLAILCTAVVVINTPSPAQAGGTVGTGTAASCTEAALDAALAGGGVVTFNCGGTATIAVANAKTVSADTTIDGAGFITLSGGGSTAIFSVTDGAMLSVANLTISGGASAAEGGAIVNTGGTLSVTNTVFSGNTASIGGAIENRNGAVGSGTLIVIDSLFSGNQASNRGGAIDNSSGVLSVINSTFLGNAAESNGGAIFSDNTLTLTDSTFKGNSAINGSTIFNNAGDVLVDGSTFSSNTTAGCCGGTSLNGGTLFNSGGSVILANSTFSANSATTGSGSGASGGAIVNDGTMTVTNATFAGNTATGNGFVGGAIFNDEMATLTNTIVANGAAGANCAVMNPFGQPQPITDGGHNLDSDGTCGLGSATDPKLDSAGLADNGGPTQTIALQPGSPAINAGDESVCAAVPVLNLDQRGFVRPGVGASNCSIGAYEYNAVGGTPANTPTQTETTTNTPSGTSTPTPTGKLTNSPTPSTTPVPTLTEVPTATPSQGPLESPTLTSTASPTPTENPSAFPLSGLCMQPGAQGLVACAPGTTVTVLRCTTDLTCGPQTLTALESTQVGTDGAFSFVLDAAQVTRHRVMLQATIPPAGAGLAGGSAAQAEAQYRIVDFGPAANIVLDPSSEAAVRLMTENGMEHYSNDATQQVIQAVRMANANTMFAGLSATDAAMLATDTARTDPTVQHTLTTLQLECAGDCDGSGALTVDELVTLVSIALGNSPLSTCLIGDADRNGQITIDEIIRAVNKALDGCVS